MKRFVDLADIKGLCYWCNLKKECEVFQKYIESGIYNSKKCIASLSVENCIEFIPDECVIIDYPDYKKELEKRHSIT